MSAPARAWLTACSAKSGKRGIVVDVDPAADLRQGAAMAVVGVFAEAKVGDHQQLGRGLPGEADRLLHDAVVVGQQPSRVRPCARGCRRG